MIRKKIKEVGKEKKNITKILGKPLIYYTIKAAKKSKDTYINFWKNFGSVMKEGIHEDYTNKENILDISLFYSSKSKKLYSLYKDGNSLKVIAEKYSVSRGVITRIFQKL